MRTVLLIAFLVALAYFFPYLPLFLLMVLIAGLIAISLHDGARLLENLGVPRKWGVAKTLVTAISVKDKDGDETVSVVSRQAEA